MQFGLTGNKLVATLQQRSVFIHILIATIIHQREFRIGTPFTTNTCLWATFACANETANGDISVQFFSTTLLKQTLSFRSALQEPEKVEDYL